MPLTYDELIRRTPEWLYANNRRLIAEMPVIIEQAEDQLMLVLDHDLFRKKLAATQTIGSATLPPPVDSDMIDLHTIEPNLLEVRSMRVRYKSGTRERSWTPMARRDNEALTMLFPEGKYARPRFYAEYGGIMNYQFFPYPNLAYEVEITANVKPLRLAVGQQTNVLTEQFPRAMEKATFRQACLFMKNYQDAQVYEAEMNQAATEANAQIGRRKRDVTGQRPHETTNVVGA